ncbi:hypothetical protein GCM10009092_19000 [Bowmanella denitrificans]|uniref:Uncharacterized protein n=1 Tax=Bowmanella denitrificans TaxID=366582 RepID=A0ABP3GVX1_9ALTE
MNIVKRSIYFMLLLFSDSLHAIEIIDSGFSNIHLISQSGDLDYCGYESIGATYSDSDFLDINTQTGSVEFYRFNAKNSTTGSYYSLVATDGLVVGRISAAYERPSDTGSPNSTYVNRYEFSGLFDSNKYQNEVFGTYKHSAYATYSDESGNYNYRCEYTYRYSMTLSNPLTSEPKPVSSSVINLILQKIHGLILIDTESRNTIPVRKKAISVGIRG